MTASAYSAHELWALGVPIEVADGSLDCGCDVTGCTRRASIIVPGAAVCAPCMDERTIRDGDGVGFYDLPLEDLVGGDEWRHERDLEYENQARRHRVEGRIAAWDERLDQLAAAAAAALIEAAGGRP